MCNVPKSIAFLATLKNRLLSKHFIYLIELKAFIDESSNTIWIQKINKQGNNVGQNQRGLN